MTASAARSSSAPVLLLTGALGSGKTTLLSRLVDHPALATAVVIVNELGDVVIDQHLVREVDDSTMVLGSGCICCSLRGDLAAELRDLLVRRSRGQLAPFDRVVIETTGVADPGPVIQTLLVDPLLRHRFPLERVVTTVDAVNGLAERDDDEVWLHQVMAADRLIVTKGDVADATAVERAVAQLNPTAGIARATRGVVDPDVLFGGATSYRRVADAVRSVPGHGTAVTSFTVELDERVDWSVFGIWLSMLLRARGNDILRVKGLLDVGGAGPLVLNGVRHVVHGPQHLPEWPVGHDRASQLVFITRRVARDEIEASLRAFLRRYGRASRPSS
ncbi:CobW family GTP-binding protein [Conexibacter woesei]|uniref:Cobalamin synthesis protein P47K n=1 Tax=Conexibacter woesei (strain DSM 14684 / CCUG 47730 / CIP 108061 / JCM 11494 / NBRC 100937 / ID131577) TaxID=469383 RepID=D3F489_CONWI|nr:GTP-binding protein [Conexibacter woesei]ADB50461.1 cobalamin synthesis protein P47K [Conexibacter woesei DSM 14684]